MSKILQLSNGMIIQNDLCSSLNCNIRFNYNDTIVNKNGLGNKLTITHIKVYKLIIEYGISKYLDDCITIDTNELTYYIFK